MADEVDRATGGNGGGRTGGVPRVLDSIVAFVGLLTPEGILVEANQSALEAAGVRAEDVLDRPFWETHWWSWSPAEQEALKNAVRRAAAGEKVRYDAEVRLVGDERVILDFQLVPLREEGGRITRLVPSGIDVTARRRAEAVLESIIANAPVGFAQFDPQMRFVRINDELAHMNGLPAEEHIGRSPMEILPDLPQEGYVPHFRAALRGESAEFEIEGATDAAGHRVWMERVYPLRDSRGLVVGIGVFVLDITDRKMTERARERSVRRLQQSLLPGGIPPLKRLEVATRYATAPGSIEVGGDFYEVLEGPSFGVAAFVGDVCGRGVEAAALTSMARYTLVPLIELHPRDPATAITELDRIMREHHPETSDRFLTLALAVLRPQDDGLHACITLGGHPPPVVVRRDGDAFTVGRPGTLLASGPVMRAHNVSVVLAPGDALVLYTDGYTEARGADGDIFDERRLVSALAEAAGGSAEAIADALQTRVEQFTHGRAERDDRALVVLMVTG